MREGGKPGWRVLVWTFAPLLSACGAPLARAPEPAAVGESIRRSDWDGADAAAEMAARGQMVVVERRGVRLVIVEGCSVPATYVERGRVDGAPAASGAPPAVEWTLASLQQNLVSDDAACASATHVVTRVGGPVAEIMPMARPRFVDDATHIVIGGRRGEQWSLRSNETRLCELPCATWMRPSAVHSLVREADQARVEVYGPQVHEPELHLTVGFRSDPMWPWLGIVFGAFGAGATATTLLIAPSPSGHESGSGGASGSVAGMLVVGALAVGLDAWSLYYLIKGPSRLPELSHAVVR